MNYSAYLAEIFRGAIDSVEKSQWEAAKVFCMSDFQIIYRIVLPQALIAALPSLGNSFMDLIKVSSIGMTIGIMDLMGRAQAIAATYYSVSKVYILAALMYWSISIILSKVQNKFESKIKEIY